MEQELSTMKVSFGAATKDRAVMETKIKELTTRITEITNINNNVTMVKTKLENELKSVTADYDDIARELKLADDRANKASGDAAHFESLMREEHARLVQLDQAKKALETEVGRVDFSWANLNDAWFLRMSACINDQRQYFLSYRQQTLEK